MNSNFKYFNILWYNPKRSDDFNNYKKCFENVEFYRAYDLEAILKLFKEETIYEWIIITPESKGDELIQNLEEKQCIKAFFFYNWNTELHKQLEKKTKKMQNIASNPEILCQKLIELNKEYLIQDFNYNNKNEIKSQCSEFRQIEIRK